MKTNDIDKIIYLTTELDMFVSDVFKLFTENKHLEKWLTNEANVEAKLGGSYELFWNPQDKENDSTIGCKIVAYNTNKLSSFEWRGAKQFKHFMNTVRPLTNVSVFFRPKGEQTEIHLIHTGWRNTPEWDEAFKWFEKAWTISFEVLKEYIKQVSQN